jgi:hypothetical protein
MKTENKGKPSAAGDDSPNRPAESLPTCGIVMPISTFDDCSEEHWYDVRQILIAAIEDAGFVPTMVSDAEDIGVIQKRIIQNVYSNPIVVCDVSGKNPNVMFELGMRLAFDKPTLIVKDDKTAYSFDTAPIEHLEYPRDLRFPKVVDFQTRLAEKIRGTHKQATTDPNYTTFLKHFGTFSVPTLETKEVSKEDFILEEMRTLKALVARLGQTSPSPMAAPRPRGHQNLCLRECSKELLTQVVTALRARGLVPEGPRPMGNSQDHFHLPIGKLTNQERMAALEIAAALVQTARLWPK